MIPDFVLIAVGWFAIVSGAVACVALAVIVVTGWRK